VDWASGWGELTAVVLVASTFSLTAVAVAAVAVMVAATVAEVAAVAAVVAVAAVAVAVAAGGDTIVAEAAQPPRGPLLW